MNTTQIVALVIFVATMSLIMTEKVHRMTAAIAGSLAMILSGILTIESGMHCIDADTICILVGMMLFVGVVKKSGLFEYTAIKAAKLSRGNPWIIMVTFIIITAFLSAFLDNVTTVLLIGPMTYAITRAMKLNPVPYIMTQIMASNIGGTATLIGDPPNIMIGSAAHLSFMDFIKNVGPPVIFVLGAVILIFYFLYGKKLPGAEHMQEVMNMDEKTQIHDRTLMIKSLVMIAILILAFIFQDFIGLSSAFIALFCATVMLIIGKQNVDEVVESVEWPTIVFFVGLFVIVGGLKESGLIDLMANAIVDVTSGNMLLTIIVILWVSALLSSFLDNIPFVATMIPLITALSQMGVDVMPLWWSLSLGACIGGNGTLIGASANVVLSGISAREGHPITFAQYFKVGFPIMLVSIAICMVYLIIRYA